MEERSKREETKRKCYINTEWNNERKKFCEEGAQKNLRILSTRGREKKQWEIESTEAVGGGRGEVG